MAAPIVTAVVPVFNAADYVERAVDSALGQRGVDLEVIVIDDGSTDRSWEILETFGDNIRRVRQTNAGQVRTRNKGASLARGQWIAFLDADDEWAPDKLAAQLARADSETGLVYTDCENIGDALWVKPRMSHSVRHFEGDVLEPLLLQNFIANSSVMIRKSWFDLLGGYSTEFEVCEDWYLWLSFAAQGGIVRLCPEPLTRYRWRAGSLSRNQNRNRDGRLAVVQRALLLPRIRDLPAAVKRRALANAWKCSASFAANGDEPWKAAVWYCRAGLHWPLDPSLYKGLVKSILAGVMNRGKAPTSLT